MQQVLYHLQQWDRILAPGEMRPLFIHNELAGQWLKHTNGHQYRHYHSKVEDLQLPVELLSLPRLSDQII